MALMKKEGESFVEQFAVSRLEQIVPLAEAVASVFPVPEYIRLGLSELLINAHEHGNLGLGGQRKSALLKSATWQEKVLRLERLPENSRKKVTLECCQRPDGTVFKIMDEGQGFDWRRYLSADAMEEATLNGRGIVLANQLCFDALFYNEKGNEVTAVTGQLPVRPIDFSAS